LAKESQIPTWTEEFKRAKDSGDLSAIDTLYNKVKVALNGLAQSKGEETVKEFQALKQEIEQYAEEWKAAKNIELSQQEKEISKELKITENEAKRARAAKPKRTRKSKPIVEAIESETKVIEDSNDGERAADLIQTIEAAETAILKDSNVDESFDKKYGVSETELYKEYASLDKKQANIGKAYEALTGKELKGAEWRASDEDKALYNQFVTDFLNAISKEGLILKAPIPIEGDVQLEYISTPIKPLKNKGVASLDGIVAKDEMRPALQGVYIDNGNYVATDANQLVIIKKTESDADVISKFREALVKQYSKIMGVKEATIVANNITNKLKEEGLNGKILDFKNGIVVDGKYPNYKAVIPNNILSTKEQPIQDWINIANGVVSAMKNIGSKVNILMLNVEGDANLEIGVNAKLLLSSLQTLQANGAKTIRIGVKKHNVGITLNSDNGDLGLVMPIMTKSDNGDSVPRTVPKTIKVSVIDKKAGEAEIKRLESEIKKSTSFYAKEYADAVKEKDDDGIKRYKKYLEEEKVENQERIDEIKNALNPDKLKEISKALRDTAKNIGKGSINVKLDAGVSQWLTKQALNRAADLIDLTGNIIDATRYLTKEIKAAMKAAKVKYDEKQLKKEVEKYLKEQTGLKKSKEDIKEFNERLKAKKGNSNSDSEVEAAFDNIVNPPSGEKPNTEQSSPKKRKKALLNRGYEGVTREDVKQAIKEMGLDYEVESRDIAKADAKAFIEKVGIKNAIKAVRTGKIVGARAAFVWAEAIDSIENMLSKARSESRKRNLSKALAELMDEFTTQSREGGRFISALADIYATSDFPYKLTNQIEKYKAINNGIISPEVLAKFEQYEKELNDLNEQIKVAEERAKLAEEQAAVNNIKEDVNRPKENNTYSQMAKKAADSFRKRFKTKPKFYDENGNEIEIFTAGFTWNDLVELAAKAIEKTGNVADGLKAVSDYVKESGVYKSLSKKSQNALDKQINEQFGEKETDGKLKIKHSLIRELVEQGNNDIDSLTAAVKEAIKEEYPDATDREVRDAITGYGKTVNQNQEEIEKEIRQIKFIGKYLSALEDIAQKKRPLKSGAQRDKLTAEQRQKLKEIREAMKDLPIDLETQESQLKTALDAAKSRVKNRIEDLQREIDTKELTKKNNKELVADEELKTLIEQRDALQYAHDLVFKGRPQTAGEKRIASLQKKLDDLLFKDIKGEGESAVFTAEEQKRIDDINEQIAKAKADLGLIKSKPLPKTEMEKAEAREQAKIDKLQTKLDELKQGIVNEKETKERTKESKEVIDLREQIEREKQLLGLIEAAPTQAEKTELAIDAAIEETERKIRENDLAYEKANKVSTPEIEAKREILKASKEALNKLREETGLIEKRRLENAKKATQRRIDELERRIREKDFSKKKSKPLIQDTELVNLNAKKLVVKGKFDKLQYENELRNRSEGEKIKDAIAEIWSLPRAVVATGEFSFVLIQGGIYTVSNPTLAWNAFKKAMQSFTSEKKANDYLNFIQAQEFYPRMKASKLALTEVDAKLTAREEQFLSGWVNHIWDMSIINWGLDKAKVNKDLRLKGNIYETWKALNPIKAIERAGVAFLNTMRVEKYLQGEEMLKMRGITFQSRPNDYKQMADVINTFTGRASLGKVLEPNAKGLSNILFSPRNWASLLKQVLLPLYLVNKGSKGEGEGTMSLLRQGKIKPSVAQKMAMTDFLKAVGITTSFVMLAAYALNNDDDDETEVSFDMTSSDFMKVRLGNLRLDPWGGKIQQVVFLNRLFADLYNYEGNFLNIAFKTLKNKLSPSTRLAVNYAEKKINAQGYLTDPYGNEYSLQNEITGDAYPMYLGTLSELNKDQQALIATSAGALAFFGFGMQVYESKENFKKPVKDYFKEINYKPSIDKRMDEDFIDLQGQPISEDDYAKFVINVNQKFNAFLDANLEKVKKMEITIKPDEKLTSEQKEEKKKEARKRTIASAQNSIEKMEVLSIKLANRKITKAEYDKEMAKVVKKMQNVMEKLTPKKKPSPNF